MNVYIIGAGLAGCECALHLAGRGIPCTLFEQKPENRSPAHSSELFCELVCSNSFRSDDADTSAVGLLKEEMRRLGSAVMAAADLTKVPAGKALAVDREAFAREMTRRILENPLITVVRREIRSLDEFDPETDTVVLAAGPVASEAVSADLARLTGEGHCYFYDAIAPIVSRDSVDMSIAFKASRYGNCPPPPITTP